MSVLSALSDKSDSAIVKDAEGRVSGFWARYPMLPPEKSSIPGGPCKLVLKYLGEHDEIIRDRYLLEEKLQLLYTYPKRSTSGEEGPQTTMGLFVDSTVREYLDKHPEDAIAIGLNGFRLGEDRPYNPREEEILKKNLEQFLEEKPEIGYRLGDKALAFRIQATLRNLKDIDRKYRALLDKSLPELKQRKENGYPLWARAYHAMRHGLNKSLWWVRDNPILGLTGVATLIVVLKLGFVLWVLDEARSGHKKESSKKNPSAPPPQPAQAFRSQPPPYPPQAWPQPYAPQPYYPQQYPMQQATVFPAPYFQQMPTPLQTALNMPTG